MLSYNSCFCFGPVVGISKYREAGSFTRRKHSNGFVCFPYKFNSRMVKSYGRYGYEYGDNYDNDDDYWDFDSDGYCSEDDLLPDLNNLNSENAKSVGKTSGPGSLMAVKGPSCPEKELKHVNEKTNVLPMHETRLSSSGTSRADSSLLQPTSLNLSQKEREKRAIEIIQQQKLRQIAMGKKKAKHEIMFKSSVPKDVETLSESIAMEKKRAESIAMEKKKTEQKDMLKSSKAEDVDLLTGRSMIMHSTSAVLNVEIKAAKIEDIKRYHMKKQLGYEAKCGPLIQYLRSMGFKESHLVRIHDRHKSALQIKVEAVRKRLDFLVSVGVKSEDLVKIITRHPQILEYTIDGKIKSHIEFLRSLGVPASRLGRILTAAPSLLSYNVELSLKPKIRFLTEEVGIERKKLGKIVVLSPQILIQSVEDSMKCRLDFLSKELGASKDSLVKMVTKHPQLLHYNIEDGIKPRIDFLRSIGMSNADIVKVLTRLTQILSLSVEKSLRPKYLYLVKELNNGVQSLIANPTYFSLSLEQRIWARHRFLISLNKVPSGPFPLTALLVADDSFCAQWANSTLEDYEAFRKELILSKLKRHLLQKYGSCL